MTVLLIILARAATLLAQPPAEQPAQPQPPVEVQAPPLEIKVRQPGEKPQTGEIRSADDLLTALETADAGLNTLAAGIRYDRTFEIAGDRQVREGNLYFQARREGDRADRKFAIRFDRLIVGARVREEVKEFVFDGEWLVEKLPGEKPPMFTKRQVVPPGERFDPLRIGEGPMPIPIGQRRADILSRYDAELVRADADLDEPELKAFVKDSYQLKLTPRPDRPDEDEFSEIRLWYRRAAGEAGGMLLPRMARTINRAGDESVVQLINVQVNTSIPEGVMATQTPGPKDGWDVQIVPYRQGLKEEPAAPDGPR